MKHPQSKIRILYELVKQKIACIFGSHTEIKKSENIPRYLSKPLLEAQSALESNINQTSRYN